MILISGSRFWCWTVLYLGWQTESGRLHNTLLGRSKHHSCTEARSSFIKNLHMSWTILIICVAHDFSVCAWWVFVLFTHKTFCTPDMQKGTYTVPTKWLTGPVLLSLKSCNHIILPGWFNNLRFATSSLLWQAALFRRSRQAWQSASKDWKLNNSKLQGGGGQTNRLTELSEIYID